MSIYEETQAIKNAFVNETLLKTKLEYLSSTNLEVLSKVSQFLLWFNLGFKVKACKTLKPILHFIGKASGWILSHTIGKQFSVRSSIDNLKLGSI